MRKNDALTDVLGVFGMRGGGFREFFLLDAMYSLKARAACVSAKSVSYKIIVSFCNQLVSL